MIMETLYCQPQKLKHTNKFLSVKDIFFKAFSNYFSQGDWWQTGWHFHWIPRDKEEGGAEASAQQSSAELGWNGSEITVKFSALMMAVSWGLGCNSLVSFYQSNLERMRNPKDGCDSGSWGQQPKGECTTAPTHGAGGRGWWLSLHV